MFYYWNDYRSELGFDCVGQVIAKAVDGRKIIDFTKEDGSRNLEYMIEEGWEPFKYFELDGEVFEFDSTQFRLYADRSFGMYDAQGNRSSGNASTEFTPISPEEAAKKAIYFLNLNPDDPWPLSKNNQYWDGAAWCGSGKEMDLVWGENDDFIMIPFCEILGVLETFKVTK